MLAWHHDTGIGNFEDFQAWQQHGMSWRELKQHEEHLRQSAREAFECNGWWILSIKPGQICGAAVNSKLKRRVLKWAIHRVFVLLCWLLRVINLVHRWRERMRRHCRGWWSGSLCCKPLDWLVTGQEAFSRCKDLLVRRAVPMRPELLRAPITCLGMLKRLDMCNRIEQQQTGLRLSRWTRYDLSFCAAGTAIWNRCCVVSLGAA